MWDLWDWISKFWLVCINTHSHIWYTRKYSRKNAKYTSQRSSSATRIEAFLSSENSRWSVDFHPSLHWPTHTHILIVQLWLDKASAISITPHRLCGPTHSIVVPTENERDDSDNVSQRFFFFGYFSRWKMSFFQIAAPQSVEAKS